MFSEIIKYLEREGLYQSVACLKSVYGEDGQLQEKCSEAELLVHRWALQAKESTYLSLAQFILDEKKKDALDR